MAPADSFGIPYDDVTALMPYSRRDIVKDLNAVGANAPAGSIQHVEFHDGLEPSMGKLFAALRRWLPSSSAVECA